MSFFNGIKSTPAPIVPQLPYVATDSLESRSNDASALAAYATEVFTRTAYDLDEAAARQDEVAAEAQGEIVALQDLRDNALSESMDARWVARKIRAIFA